MSIIWSFFIKEVVFSAHRWRIFLYMALLGYDISLVYGQWGISTPTTYARFGNFLQYFGLLLTYLITGHLIRDEYRSESFRFLQALPTQPKKIIIAKFIIGYCAIMGIAALNLLLTALPSKSGDETSVSLIINVAIMATEFITAQYFLLFAVSFLGRYFLPAVAGAIGFWAYMDYAFQLDIFRLIMLPINERFGLENILPPSYGVLQTLPIVMASILLIYILGIFDNGRLAVVLRGRLSRREITCLWMFFFIIIDLVDYPWLKTYERFCRMYGNYTDNPKQLISIDSNVNFPAIRLKELQTLISQAQKGLKRTFKGIQIKPLHLRLAEHNLNQVQFDAASNHEQIDILLPWSFDSVLNTDIAQNWAMALIYTRLGISEEHSIFRWENFAIPYLLVFNLPASDGERDVLQRRSLYAELHKGETANDDEIDWHKLYISRGECFTNAYAMNVFSYIAQIKGHEYAWRLALAEAAQNHGLSPAAGKEDRSLESWEREYREVPVNQTSITDDIRRLPWTTVLLDYLPLSRYTAKATLRYPEGTLEGDKQVNIQIERKVIDQLQGHSISTYHHELELFGNNTPTLDSIAVNGTIEEVTSKTYLSELQCEIGLGYNRGRVQW